MILILILVIAFLGYRLYRAKGGQSVVSISPILSPVGQALFMDYAAKIEAEILGKIHAADSLKAKADMAARAAEAASATAPPKA